MSTVGDIMDSIEDKISAITLDVVGEPLHLLDDDGEAINDRAPDDLFERSFTVMAVRDLRVMKAWGDGSQPEVEQTISVKIGYLVAGDMRGANRRIASDQEQLIGALQVEGLTWPAALTNIRPTGTGSVTDVGGGGNNVLVLEMRWLLTYDI